MNIFYATVLKTNKKLDFCCIFFLIEMNKKEYIDLYATICKKKASSIDFHSNRIT